MTRINRTNKDDKDFYPTPKELCWAFNKHYNIEDALDPCCGLGVMKEHILGIVEQYDLYPQMDVEEKDFLTETRHYTTIIANPPYKLKYKFIDKALELSDRVFMLLPLQVSTYNMFVRQYLMTSAYQGRLLITPKIFMRGSKELEFGGSITYCWYEWDKNKPSNTAYEIYEDLVF